MAHDETLAQRVREVLATREGISERNMFGGVCFMHWGNMVCGVEKSRLMFRVGPEAYEDALTHEYTTPMDFTGRPMRGFVFVAPAGFATDVSLMQWIDRALNFTGTLPRKSA